MILYRAYSLVPSSRLTGEFNEAHMRVDWICYLREKPLIPYRDLIEDYIDMENNGESLSWVQERANNFLTEPEVDELRVYLKKKYDFSIDIEEFYSPITLKDLPWFKEKYVNNTIVLSDNEADSKLSVGVLGMVSPFKKLDTVNTVNELIYEIDKQNEK
jgi:hypothetical protein